MNEDHSFMGHKCLLIRSNCREHQESETDTEEFEKVGCSAGSDGTFSPMEVSLGVRSKEG